MMKSLISTLVSLSLVAPSVASAQVPIAKPATPSSSEQKNNSGSDLNTLQPDQNADGLLNIDLPATFLGNRPANQFDDGRLKGTNSKAENRKVVTNQAVQDDIVMIYDTELTEAKVDYLKKAVTDFVNYYNRNKPPRKYDRETIEVMTKEIEDLKTLHANHMKVLSQTKTVEGQSPSEIALKTLITADSNSQATRLAKAMFKHLGVEDQELMISFLYAELLADPGNGPALKFLLDVIVRDYLNSKHIEHVKDSNDYWMNWLTGIEVSIVTLAIGAIIYPRIIRYFKKPNVVSAVQKLLKNATHLKLGTTPKKLSFEISNKAEADAAKSVSDPTIQNPKIFKLNQNGKQVEVRARPIEANKRKDGLSKENQGSETKKHDYVVIDDGSGMNFSPNSSTPNNNPLKNWWRKLFLSDFLSMPTNYQMLKASQYATGVVGLGGLYGLGSTILTRHQVTGFRLNLMDPISEMYTILSGPLALEFSCETDALLRETQYRDYSSGTVGQYETDFTKLNTLASEYNFIKNFSILYQNKTELPLYSELPNGFIKYKIDHTTGHVTMTRQYDRAYNPNANTDANEAPRDPSQNTLTRSWDCPRLKNFKGQAVEVSLMRSLENLQSASRFAYSNQFVTSLAARTERLVKTLNSNELQMKLDTIQFQDPSIGSLPAAWPNNFEIMIAEFLKNDRETQDIIMQRLVEQEQLGQKRFNVFFTYLEERLKKMTDLAERLQATKLPSDWLKAK